MTDSTQHAEHGSRRRRWTWRRALMVVLAFLLLTWLMIGFVNPSISGDGGGGSEVHQFKP